MINIIFKGYKYLLHQLTDFLGPSFKTIKISLKSVQGRIKYEKLFGKKIKDKKDNKRVRTLSVNQSMLTDFIPCLFNKTMSIAAISSYFLNKNANFKIISEEEEIKNKNKKKNNKHRAISIYQTFISDFLEGGIDILKRKINIPYKIKPRIVKIEDYMENSLSKDQILAFQHYVKFRGYLSNIFTLNSYADVFFTELQTNMGYKPQIEALSLNNIFKLEIARCKLGFSNLESFIREYNENRTLRNELGISSDEKITLTSYRRNLELIIPYVDSYSEILLEECKNLKLIGNKIWAWDRRFFQCNCSGLKNKKTGTLSDSDAGHYVKKTGKYSVLSGTGYTDTCIVDSWWGLPVYWDAVNASMNDNTIFQNTIDDCMNSTTEKPLLLIADAGPDSHISNETVVNHEVIPIIAARSNSVGNILKTEKGSHFRVKYIPRKYWNNLGKIYNIRTTVERKNANDVVGYNRSKTLTRGAKWAKFFVAISSITALLTALTAFKTGRHDLIRAPNAFRRLCL